jgi:hypothetical protein
MGSRQDLNDSMPPTHSRTRRGTFRVLAAFLGVVIALILAEGIVRLGSADELPPAALGVYQSHPSFGWSHRPSSSVRIDQDEYHATIDINSHGLRDREYAFQADPGAYRILVLGDSFADAVQVPLEVTFHARLEEQLDSLTKRRVEVINAGVDAWGTDQECLYYEEEGRKYGPDLTLLFFTLSNDVRDVSSELMLRDRGRLRLKPYFGLHEGELELELFPREETFHGIYETHRRPPGAYAGEGGWRSPLTFVLLRSRLVQVLYDRLERRSRGTSLPGALEVYRTSISDPEWERAWTVVSAFLERLKLAVARDQGDFAVVFVPDPRAVDSSFRRTYEEEIEEARKLDWDHPRRKLSAILRELHISYFDPYDVFRKETEQQPGTLYFPRNRHWTEAGHQFVADRLVDWLTDQQVLERE